MGSTFTPPGLSEIIDTPPPSGGFTPPALTDRVDSFHPLDSASNAIHNFWDQIKNGPANLVGVGKSLVGLGTGDTEKAMGSVSQELLDRAKDSYNKGDYVGTAAHLLNYTLSPIVGDSLDNAGKQFQNGDISGGTGTTLGVLGNLATAAKIPEVAAKIPDIVKAATTAPPELDLIKAYNPADPRFIDKIPDGAADIKAASGKTTLNNEDVIASAPDARTANRQVWNQWMDKARQIGAQTNGNSIVGATKDSLSSTLDPAAQQKILDEANRIYGSSPLNADTLQELLQEKNGELKPFYSKDEAARSAAEQAGARTGRSQALLEAQSNAIRSTLYNMLDPDNGGAGPRDIQGRYGAISTLEDEAKASRNTILGQQAGSLLDKTAKAAVSVLDIPGKIIQGNTEGALLGPKQAFTGSIDPIIKRAFSNIGEARPYAVPTQTDVKGLLGSAPVVTPPPADTSFVRSVQGIPQPPNPARALNPAQPVIVTPPPADTSYVKVATGNPYEKPMITEGGGPPKMLESQEAKQPPISPTDASMSPGQRGSESTSEVFNNLRDPEFLSQRLYGKTYSKLPRIQQQDIDAVVSGRRGLNMRDLLGVNRQ